MAYNSTKPHLTDKLSNSQADLSGNFTAIQALIEVNHVTFSKADFGKHTVVSFPVQSLAPGAVPDQIDLYNIVVNGAKELCIQRADGTSNPITSALKATPGWTYLPSGLILQWGTGTLSKGGNPVGFSKPFSSACYSVQLTVNCNGSENFFVMADTLSVSGFIGYSTTRSGGSGDASIYYMAIGY